jgi:hypothetical protein
MCIGHRAVTSSRGGSTCPCMTAGATMGSSGGSGGIHVGWPWRAALHGGSHDLSLRASGWGPPFGKLQNEGEGIKIVVSVIPSGK